MRHFRCFRRAALPSTALFTLLLLLASCGSDPVVPVDDPVDTSGNDLGGEDAAIDKDAEADTEADTSDKTDSGGACVKDEDCKGKVTLKTCETEKCDAGTCVAIDAPDDAACDDGWKCTGDNSGRCKNGACKAQQLAYGSGAACLKSGDTLPAGFPSDLEYNCVIPSCKSDDSGDCDYKNVPQSQNKLCDDEDSCTENDKCQFGGCFGEAVEIKTKCDDGKPCTKDDCNPNSGCVHADIANGEACDDGQGCTIQTVCTSGICGGGKKKGCDDGNPCTEDSCDAANDGKCKFKERQKGVVCDDSDKCTTKDECDGAGNCKGAPDASTLPLGPCDNAKCDPATGKTTHTAQTNGGVCTDGDNCTIGDVCTNGACIGAPLKCNDSNPCTLDACDKDKGDCANTPLPDSATCTDNNACTTQDLCTKGLCGGVDYIKTGQCNDDNVCTNDACSPQTGCFSTPKPGVCDDADPCSVSDKCDNGKCVGSPRNCDDGDPCTNDSCDKTKSGTCAHDKFQGPCDDNNKCTENDSCNNIGKCTGKAPDCDDKNECTTDVCDTQKGCQHLSKPGGTPCKDELECTSQEVCSGGKCLVAKNECTECAQDADCAKLDDGDACTGVPKCLAGGPGGKNVCDIPKSTIPDCAKLGDGVCSIGTCNTAKGGACEKSLRPEGAPCDDNNKCTEKTFCQKAGACSGAAIDCDDKQGCTKDSCDPTLGCLHVNLPDKSTCDDNNKCTVGDACSKGSCTPTKDDICACANEGDCAKFDDGDLCNGIFECKANFCKPKADSAVKCEESKNPCSENFCQKVTGKCEPVAKQDGDSCDDGNKCTVKDFCSTGKCAGTDWKDVKLCGDGEACAKPLCDSFFGCNLNKFNAGDACNDGNACTVKTKCKADGKNMLCVGDKLDCDDGNACTLDNCKAGSGCANQIDDSLKCDDNDPCTTGDACKSGVCDASGVNCDDKNPCTIDVCAGKDGCKNVVQGGKDCDDGKPCTISDSCDLAGKCAGKQKNCNDGTDCTADSCVNGSCVSTARAGEKCDDKNACTSKDVCDDKGACVAQVLDCDDQVKGNICRKVVGKCSPTNGCTIADNDGVSCSDDNLCTISDKCSGGGCEGLPLKCDDNNPCTVDSCDPKAGCRNALNTCDDANDCTFDKCDPPKSPQNPTGTGKGCVNDAIDGFQPCKDDNSCTTGGKCSGSKCEQTQVSCNDSNPCTLDSCDPKYELKKDDKAEAACVFLPDPATTTACDDGNKCTTDFCNGLGKCVGTDNKCDDNNECTIDTCDKLKGCITADAKDGATCDDGDQCTQKTVCHGGLCAGGNMICEICKEQKDCDQWDNNTKCDGYKTCVIKQGDKIGRCEWRNNPDVGQEPIICDAEHDLKCAKNLCDPATGQCKLTELVNSTSCDDGDSCTSNDTCQNGICRAGKDIDCSGVADACNTAACRPDPSKSAGYECVAIPIAATTLCDADGSGCTFRDTCDAGKCVAGKKIDCSGTAKECEIGSCKSTGSDAFTCEQKPAKDGDACEDDQFCSADDTCKAGKCVAGSKAPDCSKFETACSTGICDPKANGGFGACQPKIKPDSDKKACNSDDNGCTVNDICANGVCVPGAPPDCNSKTTTCTVGACKSTGAAQYECVGAPALESKPCEADKDGCTVGDRCVKGVCSAGSAPDCSAKGDGKCLVGTCKSLGTSHYDCQSTPAQQGESCDADGNGCTRNDACNDKGACQPGPSVNCNKDGGTCAVGTCISKSASTFECGGDSKPDGTACDADADGCTVGDKCIGGKCKSGSAPDCSKFTKGQCIVGACTNKGSDKYICEEYSKKDGETCDADKDGCTKDDACEGAVCQKGTLETCKAVAGLCVTSECKSSDVDAYKCLVTPKESYPALYPAVACTPTDAQPKCAVGYKCNKIGTVEKIDEAGKKYTVEIGECEPTVTINCDDGTQCTELDGCSDGKCAGAKPVDCNDNDGCTLDACTPKDGACTHKVVAGCVKCIDDKFEPLPDGADKLFGDWSASSAQPCGLAWTLDKKGGMGISQRGLRIAWGLPVTDAAGKEVPDPMVPWLARDPADECKPVVGGPGGGKAQPVLGPRAARLLHRRYYLQKSSVTPHFTMRFLTKFSDTSCSTSMLRVVINGDVLFEQCGNSNPQDFPAGDTNERLDIELDKYMGTSIDIELQVWGQAEKAGTDTGEVLIDDITLTGACGPGCAASDFETRQHFLTAFDLVEPGPGTVIQAMSNMPQPWTVAASAANYMKWQNTSAAHLGKLAMQAKFSGAPPAGKLATASIRVPLIRVLSKDKLYFALHAPDVAGGARLQVKVHEWNTGDIKGTTPIEEPESVVVASKVVFTQDKITPAYDVVGIDLSQWAAKTIDVEFIAESGAGNDTAGTFNLDSVAVQGLCTYACFIDNFDTEGLSGWKAKTAIKGAVLGLETQVTYSKPNAVKMEYPKGTKSGPKAWGLLHAVDWNHKIQAAPLGISYEYRINVTMSANVCPTPTTPPGTFLVSSTALGLEYFDFGLTTSLDNIIEIPKGATSGPDYEMLMAVCESTGWKKITGVLTKEMSARDIRPALWLLPLDNVDYTKAYYDDIKFFCK